MEEQLLLEGVPAPEEADELLDGLRAEEAPVQQTDTLEAMGPGEVHKAVVLNAFDQTNLMQEILTTLKIVAQQQSALIQYLMK